MQDYKKYRWFWTSDKALVLAGKNAEQNDALLREMQKTEKNYVVMHTSRPRSPFAIIVAEEVSSKDLQECAVFTASFSSAWKDGLDETEVDIFRLDQVSKKPSFKAGMWNVAGKTKRVDAKLELALTIQENVVRAVPIKSAKKVLRTIRPGKIAKEEAAGMLAEELEMNKQDLLSALPTGGVDIR